MSLVNNINDLSHHMKTPETIFSVYHMDYGDGGAVSILSDQRHLTEYMYSILTDPRYDFLVGFPTFFKEDALPIPMTSTDCTALFIAYNGDSFMYFWSDFPKDPYHREYYKEITPELIKDCLNILYIK